MSTFLTEARVILDRLDQSAIEGLITLLVAARDRGGRLFILGVGGGAANASHAVNDFRKLAAFEAYTPTDNVSELTARINDEGWESSFAAWLAGSRLAARDMVLVFSVGGGDSERGVSVNLVRALEFARSVGASIGAVVGRDGGFAARVADSCVIVPTVNPEHVTPHTEAFQAVIWHLIVSDPRIKRLPTKWDEVAKAVFLDRDGVLNAPVIRDGRPHPPDQVDQLVIYPGAARALDALRSAGYQLIVVTNQPDVARGTQSRAIVEAMHARLCEELPIDAVRVCYHDDRDRCGCRKPEPGMLLQDPAVDLGSSFMIGDRWRDIEAGRRAGCTTIFVDRGYQETQPVNPHMVVPSLQEAVSRILRGNAVHDGMARA